MDIIVTALIGLLVGLAAAAYLRRADPSSSIAFSELSSRVAALSDRIGADGARVSERLEWIDSRVAQAQSATAGVARDISDKLADVYRATASVAEQARQFSDLQDLLRAPKARGGLGEAMLEELLRELMPPGSFAFQHRFSSGATVDAVVRAGGRLVCIDSKFPLANYRRMCAVEHDTERRDAERAFAADVQRHIQAISSRYIVPEEQTFDFAVMYVPAEGVYAEVLRLAHRTRPLYESAIEARVVPMSPLTLIGYLQTVLYGLKCLRIEKNAREILGSVRGLEQSLSTFVADYDTLGRHLGHARLKYEEGARRLDRLGDRLAEVSDLAGDDDPERPSLEVVAD